VKLKSPGKRAIRSLVVTGVAIASITGIALSQTQALADPAVTYVAVGSDTIQDFENGWATALGGNLLGSYNATNPADNTTTHQIITPVKTGITTSATAIPGGTCSFNRPNGSTEGSEAIRGSLGIAGVTQIAGESVTVNGTAATLPANLPGTNCVDIARSSGGPITVDQTAGPLQYIPFALDAVTSAIGPSAPVTIENAAGTGTENAGPTNLGALVGVGFSNAGLQAMFGAGNDAVANGAGTTAVCYAPFQGGDAVPSGETCSSTVTVDLYIPQPGSGTLSFWATKMSFSSTNPPAWDHQHIVNGAGTTLADYANAASPGVPVEEHDGTAFAADPNGIGPFSVAQWIAQNNGINPRFHGAQLLQVGGVNPTVGGTSTSPGTLNTSFPITRQVYNDVAYDRVNNTGDGFFDPTLSQLLVGSSSLLCGQKLLIQHYGFGLLTTADSPFGTPCGDAAAQYRADA
jgi:hypothetical protein